MYDNMKHACMLPVEPKSVTLRPTASCWSRALCVVRNQMLASESHHGSVLFLRSRKRLELEQHRQIDSGYWMIFHPYSQLRFIWDCYFLFLTFIVFYYMPFQVFRTCPSRFDELILFYDASAFFDLVMNFLTGFHDEDNKVIVLAPLDIALNYARTHFICDFIGTLPLQLIHIYDDCTRPTHTVFFLFKLFRCCSLDKKWKNFYEQIRMSYLLASGLTVTLIVLLFMHWLTFVYQQVPIFVSYYYDPKDNMTHNWLQQHKVFESDQGFEKYTTSLYYVCGLFVGAGYFTPLTQHIVEEHLTSAATSLIGLLVMTYAFMALLKLEMYRNYQTYIYNGRLTEFEQYMTTMRLGSKLKERLKSYLNFQFGGSYFNEHSIIETINEHIKKNINIHLCGKLVAGVPMFRDMPPALMNCIIFSLEHRLYMPGEIIGKFGQEYDCMYLILSGTVSVLSYNGTEVNHLKDGSHFGQDALLSPGSPLSATYMALEITAIYKLSNNAFQNCLQQYPNVKNTVEESGKKRENTSSPSITSTSTVVSLK